MECGRVVRSFIIMRQEMVLFLMQKQIDSFVILCLIIKEKEGKWLEELTKTFTSGA